LASAPSMPELQGLPADAAGQPLEHQRGRPRDTKPRTGGVRLRSLESLPAPERVPPALLQLTSRIPTVGRVGVERLSGLAGRVLGGRDADVVWSWLLGRMPLSAVKNAVWRALHKAEQTTSDFYGLLAPPFEELRKRAQSLRTLSDAQLMCWDASPVGGREWMQIIILDAIITQARARAPAAVTAHVEAADPPTHACPICCRDVDAAASRRLPADAVMSDDVMVLMLHGPCYHTACYECLFDRAVPFLEPGVLESGDAERIDAALARVVGEGHVECGTCRATLSWPWTACGTHAVKGHSS